MQVNLNFSATLHKAGLFNKQLDVALWNIDGTFS